MNEDIKEAVGHVVRLLSEDLDKRKNEGIKLERNTNNFWNKLKKRLPGDVGTQMEENPLSSEAKEALTSNLGELMKTANVKMSVVSFLYNKGVEL